MPRHPLFVYNIPTQRQFFAVERRTESCHCKFAPFRFMSCTYKTAKRTVLQRVSLTSVYPHKHASRNCCCCPTDSMVASVRRATIQDAKCHGADIFFRQLNYHHSATFDVLLRALTSLVGSLVLDIVESPVALAAVAVATGCCVEASTGC